MPPFRIEEQGWGEFDMLLVLTPKDKGAEITVAHDLNFQSEHYETKHPIVSSYASSSHAQCEADTIRFLQVFKNPKPALLAILKDSGPVPGDSNGVKARDESAKKKKRPDKGVSANRSFSVYGSLWKPMLTEYSGCRLTWRSWPKTCKR